MCSEAFVRGKRPILTWLPLTCGKEYSPNSHADRRFVVATRQVSFFSDVRSAPIYFDRNLGNGPVHPPYSGVWFIRTLRCADNFERSRGFRFAIFFVKSPSRHCLPTLTKPLNGEAIIFSYDWRLSECFEKRWAFHKSGRFQKKRGQVLGHLERNSFVSILGSIAKLIVSSVTILDWVHDDLPRTWCRQRLRTWGWPLSS